MPINTSGLEHINISNFTVQNFSLTEYAITIKPLLFFIVGIVIYSLFVFKFYRFLAKRDILKLKIHHYYHDFTGAIKIFFQVIFYIIENLIVIPLLVFFWVAILAALMAFISKTHSSESLLLTSAAIVAAVRVTAYYNENLSQDLAKMIPFALLGIFIIDATFFSLDSSLTVLKDILLLGQELLFYLLFAVVIEFILRIGHAIFSLIKKEPVGFDKQ